MNVSEVIQLYREGHSTYAIADQLNTYPQKIRRILLKANEPLRDKGEAQSEALKSGRHKHPTKGTKRNKTTKIKISKSMINYFDDLSEEEKQKLIDKKKEVWDRLSDEEKSSFLRKGVKAVRKARDEGSKLEKFVFNELGKLGYIAKFHDKLILSGRNLEVDISVPSKLTAIEVDGPSHFRPIWGADKLRKQQKFDNDKDAILTNLGYSVIRVLYENSSIPLAKREDLMNQIDNILKNNKEPQVIKIEL